MPSDFRSIREWNNSKNSGFEELCCQLARCEGYPAESRFWRKGVPDSGVECFWTLPDGSEHGWQAKYFFELGDSQWQQADESVKTALENHPRLTRYTICLPIDLSDVGEGRKWSQLRRWKAHVEKWERWATARSMTVKYVFWGQHELLERLTREEHAGRRFFWFGETELSQSWFDDHLQEVAKKVGPRYSPEIHVELPVARLFNALGRTADFVDRVSLLYGEVRRHWRRGRWDFRCAVVADALDDRIDRLEQCFEQTSCLLTQLEPDCNVPCPLKKIHQLGDTAKTLAAECSGILSQREDSPREPKANEDDAAKEGQDQGKRCHEARYHMLGVYGSLCELQEFLESISASLAKMPFLFLRGEAGQGKTHLVCDVARRRIQDGAPTLILLGQHFHAGDPWQQAMNQLSLSCSRDELLGALDAASEAAGVRGLIFIDALNEGHGCNLWRDHLPAFVEVVRRFPHLGLAVTCRSSYVRLIAREDLIPEHMLEAVHPGFAEHEFDATRNFFDYYGIQRPSVPLLVPEFRNPLFLKVFCEGLKKSGQRRIPEGARGITSIFDLFLDSIDNVLWNPEFLDYRQGSRVVHQAVDTLAEQMELSQKHLPRDDAERICDTVLPQRGYSRSLLQHLLSEGVLCEDIAYLEGAERPEPVIRFAYERFSDHVIARNLLDRHLGEEHPECAFHEGNPLHGLFLDPLTMLRNSGLVQALFVQVPERTGRELFDLVSCRAVDLARDAFLQSLVWRDPESITDRTLQHVGALLDSDRSRYRVLDTLVLLATVPGHALNADLLHGHLWKTPMAERDAFWSVYLSRRFGQSGPIDRLLDWAWPPDHCESLDFGDLNEEPIRLAAVTLTWFLTTSDRFVRDRATKGLVSLLHGRLDTLHGILKMFAKVNDLYVLERLYAVAYGAVILSSNQDAVAKLAAYVFETQFADDEPCSHILLRDYARGIVEYAAHIGCTLPFDIDRARPPYQSDWPLSAPSYDELETELEGDTFHGVTSSLGRMGDFFCYTMSCLREWSQRPLNCPGIDAFSEPEDREVASDALEQWYGKLCSDKQELFRSLEDAATSQEREEKLEGVLSALSATERQTLEELTSPAELTCDPMDHFDKSAARGWILQRVIGLGWTPERFKKFDGHVTRGVGHNWRTPHKAERIGKKYQWIALHDYLAHVADNCQFGRQHEDEPDKYEGPWQIMERDIDPSLLLRSGYDVPWQTDPVSWWSPAQYPFADDSGGSDREWLRNWAATIDPLEFIDITRPEDRSAWLNLRGFCAWYEQFPKHEQYDENDRRQATLAIQGFLVPRDAWPEVIAWLHTGKHRNSDLPEGPSTLHTFLGEYPWAASVGEYGREYPWISGEQDYESRVLPSAPHPLAAPATEFHWERNYDCSCDDTFRGHLPAPWMMEKMELRWAKKALRVVDSNGDLAACDPSIEEPGPSALLLSKPRLLEFIEREQLRLFWLVSSEKMILQKDNDQDNWLGRVMFYWIYALEHGTISLKCRLGVHTTVGPTDDIFIDER